MMGSERDPYIPKRYNCAENARFDLGKPVTTISGSPVLVSKSPQSKVLQQALPSQYMATTSPENPYLLELNVSPVQVPRQREEKERYLWELQQQQQQQQQHYNEEFGSREAFMRNQQQQQQPQQQQQQQQQQQTFLSNTVNRRPTQPLSLDEQKEMLEKKAKQLEYLQQLEQSAAAPPIEAQRLSLVHVNAHKNRPPPESRGQSHFINPSAPAINVQNVLTGQGARLVELSPEQKKKAQADYVKMVEDAKNLQPAYDAAPYRRQSRPPSPSPALGGKSTLSSIGLRDTPEFKRQQYEARRAIAMASLNGAHSCRTADGYTGYTPTGTPSAQYPNIMDHPLRGAIDEYDTGIDGSYNHVLDGEGHAQASYHHDGDKRHSSGVALDQMLSVRSPAKRPGATTGFEVPPRDQHHPSPKVQATLQRLAEAPPLTSPTEEQLATLEADKRRQSAVKYALQLQQDKLVPHPASNNGRIPIFGLRAANRNNEAVLEEVQEGSGVATEGSLLEAVGEYEWDSRVNKRKLQEDLARQIASAAAQPPIRGERLSVMAARGGGAETLARDPFKSTGGRQGQGAGIAGAASSSIHPAADVRRHVQMPLHDLSNDGLEQQQAERHHYAHTLQEESAASVLAQGYAGGYSGGFGGNPLQGPNHWEGYNMTAARAAGMAGPTGPGNSGFLAGGLESSPASARPKAHATHQMHYDQRSGQGAGGVGVTNDGSFKMTLDSQVQLQNMLRSQMQQQEQEELQQQQQSIPMLKFANPAIGAAMAQASGRGAAAANQASVGGIGALAQGRSPRGATGHGPAVGNYDPSSWTAGQQFAAQQAQRAVQPQRNTTFRGGFARL